MIYPVEDFSADEREILSRYFSNDSLPVFALVNLPEAAKGALFARYSRYAGTLRRLFLDEFAATLPEGQLAASAEGQRAAEIYERVFVGFGDDSVAQLGGAHVACEWCSNVLTKIIQRPRLGVAYLEQSTRYIPYSGPVEGLGYRYYRDPALGPEYEQAMDSLFAIYSEGVTRLEAHISESFARGAEPEGAYRRAVRAKALDLLRGLLPAGSLSHVGVYASGQAYEGLLLHLAANPLPEAQAYGRLLLAELKTVIPSFVSRVERPERGGRFVDYFEARSAEAARWSARLGIDEPRGAEGPSVKLLHVDGDEDRLLAALLFEAASCSEAETLSLLRRLSAAEKAEAISDLCGGRENRRHRPGRGLEALRYRFEVVADYGAFRDLQRHRPLTPTWQWPTPALGAEVPFEVEEAGFGSRYREALEISAREHERLALAGQGLAATYAVCLAYRLRFVLDLNARAAMQMLELRSGSQGHPSYRAVAQEMHRLIGEVHPAVAQAMTHMDLSTEPRLERLLSEMRNEDKRRQEPPR